MRLHGLPPHSFLALLLALLWLTGCARVNFEETLATTNQVTAEFTDGKLSLVQTPEQRAFNAQTAETLLAEPLSQQQAVHLALVNSPALQAMLAQHCRMWPVRRNQVASPTPFLFLNAKRAR